MNHPISHLTDDELQSRSEGASLAASAEAHLADCTACQAEVLSYEQIGEAIAGITFPEPPIDFTASVLALLPEPSPGLSSDDLLAVLFATGAAVVGTLLFRQSGGASMVFQAVHHLPGKALSEAFIAATLHGHNQISILLFISTAALLLGAPLWRAFSAPRALA